MAVITLSREFGSLGMIVAQRVAENLGYRLVGRELINQAALRSGAPEVALAVIDELNLLGLTVSSDSIDAYVRAVKAVVDELAQEGNVVIVGRGGQVILRGRPDVLCVLMVAPQALRIERIAQRQSIPWAAARAQIEASDRHRRRFLKHFYNVKWDDPDLYDLVINTASTSADDASEIICHLARARAPLPFLHLQEPPI
ncbi:MAG TPA: cytidylate kinase-like family protein [Anaerolineaceae bacterium]|jgi:CMP/dCMP kinase